MLKNQIKKLCNRFADTTFGALYTELRKFLGQTAAYSAAHNFSENYLFLIAMAFSILGLNFLALNQFLAAFLCLLGYRLIRLINVLLAEINQTEQNFFVNTGDYVTFVLYIFGFALADIAQNAIGASFLLANILISGATVLNYSTSTCLFGKFSCEKLQKYLRLGVSKDNEIFYTLLIMCVAPNYFLQLSIFFGLLSLLKSLLMLSLAFYDLEIKNRNFKETDEK